MMAVVYLSYVYFWKDSRHLIWKSILCVNRFVKEFKNLRSYDRGRAGRRRRRVIKRLGKTEAWTMTFKSALNLPEKLPRGTQVKRDGLAITVERRGTASRIALRCLSLPPAPCQVCKGPHWKRDCLQRRRSLGSDSQDNQDWRCPGVPTQASVLITPE